ncbi:MAG: hypothetical protein U9N19_10640 [Thermodesulfobacteriota bacterium]|nr:hypothetical protein [Thermodesulfobacteriota bacterium]
MIEWRKLDPACRYPDRCEYIADNIEKARTKGVETNIGNERLADKSDAFDYEERGRFFYGSLRMFF